MVSKFCFLNEEYYILNLLIGHFTQVVWKDSKEFGLGVAMSNDGAVYVCANYYPPGNFNNAYSENVFPPDGQVHETKPTNNKNPPKHNFDNNNFGDDDGGFDSSE